MEDKTKSTPDRVRSEALDRLRSLLNDNWEGCFHVNTTYPSKAAEKC